MILFFNGKYHSCTLTDCLLDSGEYVFFSFPKLCSSKIYLLFCNDVSPRRILIPSKYDEKIEKDEAFLKVADKICCNEVSVSKANPKAFL